jgi:collagenase-like PrtC family protease
LAWRELGRAARTLAHAAACGVDAVLVADPALLALAPCFPSLEIHLSTQAGIGASSGVRAALAVGAKRVVVARELSLDEIGRCTGQGVEVEIFAQGALCFAVSGHCSMTSWVGGRSGNRGTCTSICRVGWSCNGAGIGRPLDMRDNSAVRVLDRVVAAGIASLKIEGRLKTPAWVADAVGLYRRALAGQGDAEAWWAEADRLGAYTGREMTDAYLTGARSALIRPDEGRSAGSEPASDDQDPPLTLRLRIERVGRRLRFTASAGARTPWVHETSDPGANARRAVDARELAGRLAETLPDGCILDAIYDADPPIDLPRRLANEIASLVAAWLRRGDAGGIDKLKIDIGDGARAILAAPAVPHPENRLGLSAAPTRARLDVEAAAAFADTVPKVPLVVELRDAETLTQLHRQLGQRLVPSLPTVIYEDDLEALAAVAAAATRLDLPLEVNGWDGWELGRAAGARLVAGPGFLVFNPVAARVLAQHGCALACVAAELDRDKLADCCAHAATPLVLTVFGRPSLMFTRAWSKAPAWTMEDARGSIRIAPRREGPVTALRPVDPYDWRGRDLPGVRGAVIEMDLCASPDPLAEWRSVPNREAHRYNLDRTLR